VTGDEDALRPRVQRAFASLRRFFAQPPGRKSRFVSDLTYAGYAAPGEDHDRAEAAGCEVFTVCQDIAPPDPRVRERWPCHGPAPWPDAEFRRAMLALTDALGVMADRMLREAAQDLGLDDPGVFARLTWSGWHHLRAARIPPRRAAIDPAAEAGKDGLLVIAIRDDSDELTVLPGAVLRFLTGGILSPAPQCPQPQPEAREQYTMTYFHVPNFQSCVRPLPGAPMTAGMSGDDYLHYGTHFTGTFMSRYPERVTTSRILAEDRLAVLTGLREQAASQTFSACGSVPFSSLTS
jgi:isopenicillin N synthase-like dioxygenase